MASVAAPPSGCRFHTRCTYAEAICHQVVPPLEGGVACHLKDRLPPFIALAERVPDARLARLQSFFRPGGVAA